ncbi:MAG TPA: enoyl-CoA hydratase-related protein [Syntrophorhabdaceae bacterium]|nr:enoyl-CoA hydratase-related protein [Syntrophorhabdaceae bacterium]HPU30694.1 enoyl-CoA hydratase-related protein [Syntrophorhabdaceae bacterium]
MQEVLDKIKDCVFTIILNRPERKNAMNSELLEALYKTLEKAEKMGAEIVVLRGAGGAFCAGGDIVEFRQAEDAGIRIDAMADTLHKCIKKIRKMGSIVISVVEGVAVGAGFGLAVACDLTVATNNSIMNMGYRRIGLTPDGGGSLTIPRLIGAKRFNELYLLSKNIDMAEAKNLGLVNVVCDEKDLENTLENLIKELKSLPMETIKKFKDLVNHSYYFNLEAHLDLEKLYISELAEKPLFKERLDSFFRKK